MLSNQSVLLACCMAVLVAAFGLLPGCATQPTQEVSVEAPDTEGSADGGTIGESIVVRTEDLMGGASSELVEPEVPDSPAPAVDMTYRIGYGDVLSFRSFDDENLSAQVVVRYDGCISLDMIPDLNVVGLTREEAEALLREKYSTSYMEPQLTLSILETSSKIFTVLGEVNTPSEYPYTRPITVLNAITAAGGMRVNRQAGDSYSGAQGQLVKALIIRNTGVNRQVQEYDLRGYHTSGPSPADSSVLPGDVVFVPESANLVYLLGEVRQPRVFAISEGLTLMRLLSQAGGFNEATARLRHVVITREISAAESKLMTFDVRKSLKTGTDMLLEPGDIIYMPRKRAVTLDQFIQRVTAPARSAMSFAQQVMSLYNMAYNTWYTKERFETMYGGGDDDRSTAAVEQALLEVQSAAQQLVPGTK